MPEPVRDTQSPQSPQPDHNTSTGQPLPGQSDQGLSQVTLPKIPLDEPVATTSPLPQSTVEQEPAPSSEKTGAVNSITSAARAFWHKHLAYPATPDFPADQPITPFERVTLFLSKAMHRLSVISAGVVTAGAIASTPLTAQLAMKGELVEAACGGAVAGLLTLLGGCIGGLACWRARRIAERDMAEMQRTRAREREHGPTPPLVTKADLLRILQIFGLTNPENAPQREDHTISPHEHRTLRTQQLLGGMLTGAGIISRIAGTVAAFDCGLATHASFAADMVGIFVGAGYMFVGALSGAILCPTGATIARNAWKKRFPGIETSTSPSPAVAQ